MSMTQYIGARYMPKFVGTYDATTAYEALSVVDNGMGTSYVANKPVPAGTPLSDTTYWAIYGSTNGAIIQLQQDLADLKAELESGMQGRRIVIVTDSYGEVTDNFISQMQSMCPQLVLNDNFFPFAYSGGGFCPTGYTWQDKFVNSGDINTVTSPSTITDVLVLGGSNDRSASISINDIMTAGSTLYTSLSSVFTNATIYVGYFGYSKNAASGPYAPSVKQAYQDLGAYGYRPIAHANSWLHYTGYVSDNVHPTASGSRLIATGVLNTIFGGGSDDVFNNRPVSVPVTMETGFTSSTLGSRLMSYHYGHRSYLKCVPSTFRFDTWTLSFTGDWVKFATIGDTFLYGANDNYHVVTAMGNFQTGGVDYCIPVALKLYDSGLYIKAFPNETLTGTISGNYGSVDFGGFVADDIFM